MNLPIFIWVNRQKENEITKYDRTQKLNPKKDNDKYMKLHKEQINAKVDSGKNSNNTLNYQFWFVQK